MNWRPIKTAPKDKQILLCYEGFSGDGEMFVNQGRWVDVPHTNQITQALAINQNPSEIKRDGQWEIAYVAIMEHGGRWNGRSFEERGTNIDPTHWMPLPPPTRVKP